MSLPRLAPIAGAAHHTQALLLTIPEAADWLAANCWPRGCQTSLGLANEVAFDRMAATRGRGRAGYRCSSRKLTAQLMRLLRSLRVYWELGFSAERLSCSFRPYWTRR